ncbi:hypothetical protein KUV50_01695 [Membranicola marinus]|uniref:Transposase IS200-like domain-containing protein n=1 Tax=Membranihabitans marinus TaxID=1227546 RepID=A0A953HR28_9BACT|nr:transposase [Membranihabitans marinus]MBY5956830.1 hypothetical protein [Membranihabitans marinus]
MSKYQNKYRIESARAQWWNYGWNGAYFITICTAYREHFFGEIKEGKMILSNTGVIADVLWWQISYHASFVELGEFQVMPNHIHGIIILDRPDVEARPALPLHASDHPEIPGKNRLRNQGKNTVSSIVGGYKSAVTKYANRLKLPNGWQPRFHDHIIRDKAEFVRISNYIRNNLTHWKEDKFF